MYECMRKCVSLIYLYVHIYIFLLTLHNIINALDNKANCVNVNVNGLKFNENPHILYHMHNVHTYVCIYVHKYIVTIYNIKPYYDKPFQLITRKECTSLKTRSQATPFHTIIESLCCE